MAIRTRAAKILGPVYLAVLLGAIVTGPAAAEPEVVRGGKIVLPISTEIVTPPLTGDGFACMVVNVSNADLGFRIAMIDARFPMTPINTYDCSEKAVYPPGFACRIIGYAAEGTVYCRIKVLGSVDKSAVRGALQSQSGDTWFGSVEAR